MKVETFFLLSFYNVNFICKGAIQSDLVTSLPGWNGPLPSNHYSGHLNVGTLSGVPGKLHYWFIESENNPSTDPVVLWLNGGPGCSSLLGLLTENGQLQLNDNSFQNMTNNIPNLFYNPFGWTRIANILYLESPKGVGFSYCSNAEITGKCVNSDDSTAQDAYEFLITWFQSYPEFSENPFYITGESYAGIYIPMLMQQITLDPLRPTFSASVFPTNAITNAPSASTTASLSCTPTASPSLRPSTHPSIHPSKHPTKCPSKRPSRHPSTHPSSSPSGPNLRALKSRSLKTQSYSRSQQSVQSNSPTIKLLGAAVGNGCIGNNAGYCGDSKNYYEVWSQFAYGHGMISRTLNNKLSEACGNNFNFTKFSYTSINACDYAFRDSNNAAGNYNTYNVYDICGSDDRRRQRRLAKSSIGASFSICSSTKTFPSAEKVAERFAQMSRDFHSASSKNSNNAEFEVKSAPGGESNFVCGGQTAAVQWLNAPTVRQALHVGDPINTFSYQYSKDAANLLPLYSSLVQSYRMLIYSGDVDLCVPFVGTEDWTRGLGYSVVNDWHPWTAKPDMLHGVHKAGYAVTFTNNFQFVTVNGAGHMVPSYQPGFAYEMIRKFLNNEVF